MDFMTILKYVEMIIETGALIGAMTFLSRAFKEKKNVSARKQLYVQGGVYAAVYLVLTAIRYIYFQ